MNRTDTPLCILFYRRGGALQNVCPNFPVYSFFLFIPPGDSKHPKNSPAYKHKEKFIGTKRREPAEGTVSETKQRAGQGEGLVEVFREKTRVKGRKDASDSELRSRL